MHTNSTLLHGHFLASHFLHSCTSHMHIEVVDIDTDIPVVLWLLSRRQVLKQRWAKNSQTPYQIHQHLQAHWPMTTITSNLPNSFIWISRIANNLLECPVKSTNLLHLLIHLLLCVNCCLLCRRLRRGTLGHNFSRLERELEPVSQSHKCLFKYLTLFPTCNPRISIRT